MHRRWRCGINCGMRYSRTKMLHIPVSPVEAGIRSGDWTMPEEIIRLVTDSITNYSFTTTPEATKTILNTGVSEDHVFWKGIP